MQYYKLLVLHLYLVSFCLYKQNLLPRNHTIYPYLKTLLEFLCLKFTTQFFFLSFFTYVYKKLSKINLGKANLVKF